MFSVSWSSSCQCTSVGGRPRAIASRAPAVSTSVSGIATEGDAPGCALAIRTWVNEELRQDSNTRHLIHDCWAQIEHLSTAFTLEVGDVISTGTPSGVGGAMKPPKWLVAGDRVRIEIARIGTLENPVIDEPSTTTQIT